MVGCEKNRKNDKSFLENLGSATKIIDRFEFCINLCDTTSLFLYPLNALEKSDVSIVYRKGSVAWNWIKNLLLEIWIMVNLIVNLKSYVDNKRVLMKKSSK